MPEDMRARLGGRASAPAHSPRQRYPYAQWETSPPAMQQRAIDASVFVGNLYANVTDDEVRELFGRYGRVADIDIHRKPFANGKHALPLTYPSLPQSDDRTQLDPIRSPLSDSIPPGRPSMR